MNIRKVIFTVALLGLSAISVNAQTTKTYYWESVIKLFTGTPEFEEPECDDCGIKVFYNSSGKVFKICFFEDGELKSTDKVRYIGSEDGSSVYEVLGKFGTGTHSAQHYYINKKNVLKVHYQFVLDGPYSSDGHFTDTPAFVFKYIRKQ